MTKSFEELLESARFLGGDEAVYALKLRRSLGLELTAPAWYGDALEVKALRDRQLEDHNQSCPCEFCSMMEQGPWLPEL